jgi:hypothetical protein
MSLEQIVKKEKVLLWKVRNVVIGERKTLIFKIRRKKTAQWKEHKMLKCSSLCQLIKSSMPKSVCFPFTVAVSSKLHQPLCNVLNCNHIPLCANPLAIIPCDSSACCFLLVVKGFHEAEIFQYYGVYYIHAVGNSRDVRKCIQTPFGNLNIEI